MSEEKQTQSASHLAVCRCFNFAIGSAEDGLYFRERGHHPSCGTQHQHYQGRCVYCDQPVVGGEQGYTVSFNSDDVWHNDCEMKEKESMQMLNDETSEQQQPTGASKVVLQLTFSIYPNEIVMRKDVCDRSALGLFGDIDNSRVTASPIKEIAQIPRVLVFYNTDYDRDFTDNWRPQLMNFFADGGFFQDRDYPCFVKTPETTGFGYQLFYRHSDTGRLTSWLMGVEHFDALCRVFKEVPAVYDPLPHYESEWREINSAIDELVIWQFTVTEKTNAVTAAE